MGYLVRSLPGKFDLRVSPDISPTFPRHFARSAPQHGSSHRAGLTPVFPNKLPRHDRAGRVTQCESKRQAYAHAAHTPERNRHRRHSLLAQYKANSPSGA